MRPCNYLKHCLNKVQCVLTLYGQRAGYPEVYSDHAYETSKGQCDSYLDTPDGKPTMSCMCGGKTEMRLVDSVGVLLQKASCSQELGSSCNKNGSIAKV